MGYATYEYYRTQYKGNSIKDEETFDSVVVEADAYVDRITMGKIREETDDVRNAVCAVAEVIEKQTHDESPTVSSESVGNHSKSYTVNTKSEAEREVEKYRKASLYLFRTGLLYRGMK